MTDYRPAVSQQRQFLHDLLEAVAKTENVELYVDQALDAFAAEVWDDALTHRDVLNPYYEGRPDRDRPNAVPVQRDRRLRP